MMNLKEIDARVLASLSGRDKLEALLADLGFTTLRSVAQEIGEEPSEVSRCFSGHQGRPGAMNRIRDKVAALADIEREDVDALLGGPLKHGESHE